MAWIYPSDQWRIWRNGICLSPITRYCFFTENICGSFVFQLLAHVLHFIALHDLTTILSESILTVCWRILSLWSAHHISMWCKRPGDGDCLVEGRSCFGRFFCVQLRWLIGFPRLLTTPYLLQWPTIVLLTILINLLNGLIVCVKYVGLMIDRAWISWMFSVILCLLKLLLFMSPTKTLLIVVILACLGLAALAFQLTKGVGDSEPSTELQEAMPALQ